MQSAQRELMMEMVNPCYYSRIADKQISPQHNPDTSGTITDGLNAGIKEGCFWKD